MVSPYDLAVPGGVQGQVSGLSSALRAAGHDVVVVAPGPAAQGDELVTVGRAVGLRANGSVAPVALSPAAAWRAGRAVRRGDFDLVHLHEPLAPILNYGCLIASPRPLVGTFHRNGSSPLYGAMSPLVSLVLSRLSARCAVSEAARRNVARFTRGDFEVLFNGIDLGRYRSEPRRLASDPTILFVGRHERRKGLAVLLDAVSQMSNPPMLWVAGHGPATAELSARHPGSARLEWLGPIGEEEKVERLLAADIFCAPSLGGESFGIVLLEAMAARCSVVASDIDGYREAANGHALLVSPNDPRSLAVALEQAVADATSGTRRSSVEALDSARRFVEQWSMSELARRYVTLYERVLGSGTVRSSPLQK